MAARVQERLSTDLRLRFESDVQAEYLYRYVHVTFAGHLGAIRDTGQNVRFFDARILFEKLLDRPPAGQEVEHQGDPDTVSADAGLAEADVGSDRDAGE